MISNKRRFIDLYCELQKFNPDNRYSHMSLTNSITVYLDDTTLLDYVFADIVEDCAYVSFEIGGEKSSVINGRILYIMEQTLKKWKRAMNRKSLS